MFYPFKFRPRFVPKIWGGRKIEAVLGKHLPADQLIGESWELYDFPPGVAEKTDRWVSAVVDNGPLAGRMLHDLVVEHGRAIHGDVPLVAGQQFPILIKFLDARENLSVQVHPDAAYVAKHPEAALKSEAWYVMENDPGARLYKGVVPGTTREAFAQAIAAGSVEQLINAIEVKPGQCHYLPSGTVHALGEGILVAEVQTPSDTTYRVFDFNRVDPGTGKPRQLHVEQALECINFDPAAEPPQRRSHTAGAFVTVSRLVTCEHFVLEKVRFSEGVEQPIPYDQPVVWIILEGRLQVRVDDIREPMVFGRGDTILLPAEMKNPVIKTLSDCVWLETTFPM